MIKIEKSTLQFLSTLSANNNREWFSENRAQYDHARENFAAFLNQLIVQTIASDSGIDGLRPSDCMYRINRDIRFSANKSPYKNNFGASIVRNGRRSGLAGYYIHIEPGGNSFAGGGIYMPEAAALKSLRQEIAYNGDDFEKIVKGKNFKRQCGELWGEQMKTFPREYAADHPHIHYLRYKSFIGGRDFSDKEVLDPDFSEKVTSVFRAVQPLIAFLNVPLTDR
jgi:uncharacterized protein (TIGR02453 family)